MGIYTPWGKSQTKTKYACGINFYTTAGHGGFKLSKKVNEAMPEALRNEKGWYEEDCEAAKVMFAFPEFFEDCQFYAKKTLKDYFPDAYEAVTGETIPDEESCEKRRRTFKRVTAKKYVGIVAWGDWAEDCPKDNVIVLATIGGKRGLEEKKQKYFIIPKVDYDKRASWGFVVERNKRYKEIKNPSLI